MERNSNTPSAGRTSRCLVGSGRTISLCNRLLHMASSLNPIESLEDVESIDCVIKLGGSALTDKQQKETFNDDLFEPYVSTPSLYADSPVSLAL